MIVRRLAAACLLLAAAACALCVRADEKADKAALTQGLWPKDRIEAAMAAVEKQRADGLLSEAAFKKRQAMLQARLAGTYEPQSLAVTDPPLNFIQNGGFEQINRNSGKKRSRWLWWGGWDWGGDYENSWEDRPAFVHSGRYSARITCTGKKGRIGINTPGLPAIGGATEYTLTFWAKGEGDNMLFVNFEEGASGVLREKTGPEWKQYTVRGKPEPGKPTYNVYFYSIGEGTIWLDDVSLVPVGGKLED
jgi:hypothetical protein